MTLAQRTESPAGPPFLDGLKVIELADGDVATALAGRMLAQLGAEVLIIEPPRGSRLRQMGPFPGGVPDREKSAAFCAYNINKRGVTLNLETATGRACLHCLLSGADAFIFSGDAARTPGLDIGPGYLEEHFPALVSACISAFGYGSPWSSWRANDLVVSAAGGVSIGIGNRGEPPLSLPRGVAESQASVAAVAGIFAALISRENDGKGDWVDASSADVWATIHCNYITTYVYRGVTGVRMGPRAGAHYPDVCLPCKDGYVVIDCAQDAMWQRLIKLMGSPAWADDPRYQDRRQIAEHYPEEVDALLTEWLKDYTREEFWALARQNRIPVAPLYSIDEVIRHPHLNYRGSILSLSWEGERLHLPGLPFNLQHGWDFVARPAPRLGQHNAEVFAGLLGFGSDEVVRLKAAGII